MKMRNFSLGLLALLALALVFTGCPTDPDPERIYIDKYPAPGGVSVTAGNGRLVVKWNAVSNAATYSVYHGVSNDSKDATYYGDTTETTLTINSGLTNSVKYYVWVQASYNGGGISPRGGGASGTPVAATTIPDAPATPTATASFGLVTVTWEEIPAAASYKVYRAPNVADTAGAYTQIGTSSAATFLDSGSVGGLLPDTKYWYRVVAVNNYGDSAPSTETSVTTQDVKALTANTWENGTLVTNEKHLYTFTIPAGTTYNVQWNHKNDGDDTKTARVVVQAYKLADYTDYLAGGSAPTPLFSANNGWTTPRAITVTTATQVLLIVQWQGTNNEGTYAIQYYDPADAALPPQTAPTLYSASVILDTDYSVSSTKTGIIAVSMNWSSFSDATGYNVYRSTSRTSGFSKIHEARETTVSGYTFPASTSYTDTSLTTGATYYYAVSAVNANGEGKRSVASPVTVPTPLTLSEGTQFTGSVTSPPPALFRLAVTTGNTYLIYRTGSVSTTAAYENTTFTDTEYYNNDYLVPVGSSFTATKTGNIIVRVSGTSTYTLIYADLATAKPMAVPTSVSAAPTSATAVNVSWSYATVSGEAITGYNVWRSVDGGTYTKLGAAGSPTATASPYSDTTVSVGHTYAYKVAAVNANGEGTQSQPTPVLSISALAADTWANGNLADSGQVDWYVFTADTTGTKYIWWNSGYSSGSINYGDGTKTAYVDIDVFSSSPSGSQVFNGNYSNTSYSSAQSFSVISGTTYFVRVRVPSDYPTRTGSYAVGVNTSSSLKPGEFTAVAGAPTLTSGTWANGNLASGGVEWFKFTATASTQYIHVTFGTLTDLRVQLYDSTGSTVGSSTNMYGSTRYTSRSVTIGNVYYVRVWPYDSSDSGSYQLAFNTSSTTP
ncbi:hypothetical protein FACS189485_12970 [Spirochaetia bacterium]|nr:hypothetical protein FACS189485_12970 [Spirochaetia bacterium]